MVKTTNSYILNIRYHVSTIGMFCFIRYLSVFCMSEWEPWLFLVVFQFLAIVSIGFSSDSLSLNSFFYGQGCSASPYGDENLFVWNATVFGPEDTPWEGINIIIVMKYFYDFLLNSISIVFRILFFRYQLSFLLMHEIIGNHEKV